MQVVRRRVARRPLESAHSIGEFTEFCLVVFVLEIEFFCLVLVRKGKLNQSQCYAFEEGVHAVQSKVTHKTEGLRWEDQ